MGRSPRLDAVRGVAILLILLGHYLAQAVSRHVPALAQLSPMMWIGVDLFFVLSGFLLGGILLRNRDADAYYSAFYGRRFLRILPLYAVCVALFFAHPLSAGEPLWPYLTFTQNIVWTIDGRWGPPATAPMWSVAVEEQFYVVLALLIRFVVPARLPSVLIALIVAAPFVRAAFHAAGLPFGAYYMLPSRMDSLFLGVLIAWLHQRKFLDQHTLLAGLLASGAGLLALLLANVPPLSWLMSVVGISVVAVFCGCAVGLAAQGAETVSSPVRVLALFGLGAYSIYLFHMPLLTIASGALGPSVPLLAACLAAICGLAWASWTFIERPCIALGHRMFRYSRERGAPVAELQAGR